MMSAEYILDIPTSCGTDSALQTITFNQGESQALACVPEHKPVITAPEAAFFGGGVVALLVAGALFANRNGGAS